MSKNFRTVSKTTDFEKNIKKSDLALPSMISEIQTPDIIQVDDNDIKDAVVYENGVTSIDFMMPEEERQILENNLNVYGDIAKANKILKTATSNMKLRQGIKELEQIDKLGEGIDIGQAKLNEMLQYIDISSYAELQKTDPEAASKAIKNVSIALSSMMQVRDNKVKSLSGTTSNKKMKIGIVFKNDNGDETSLGVEI